LCLKTLHRKYTKAIAVIVLIDWYYCTFKKIIQIVLENNSDKKCPNGCFITSKVQFFFAVEIEFYTKNLFLHSVLYNKWNTQIFKHKNLYSLRQYAKTLTLIHFKWNSHGSKLRTILNFKIKHFFTYWSFTHHYTSFLLRRTV